MFGVASILIIPRVRRYIAKWADDQLGEDLTSQPAVIVVGATYGIAAIIALMLMLGYVGNNNPGVPVGRSYGIWFLIIVIMYGIAFAVVTGIRITRKLSPSSPSGHNVVGENEEADIPDNTDESAPISAVRRIDDTPDETGRDTTSESEPESGPEPESEPEPETESKTDWFRGIQIFAGLALFLFGVGATIQSPVGILFLLAGLALIPAARSWGLEKLGN